MELKISNLSICEIIWNTTSNHQKDLPDIIIENFTDANNFSTEQTSTIRQKLINSFIPNFKQKWSSVTRNKKKFMIKYKDYLEKDFIVHLPLCTDKNLDLMSYESTTSTLSSKGRPRKSYEEGCEKTKRARLKELVLNHSSEELSKAVELNKSQSTENCTGDDEVHQDYRQDINDVLVMNIDLGFTKREYEEFRVHNEKITGYKYPIYTKVAEAKTQCYPENIEVSDYGAKVNFISLLEHTVKRILMTLGEDKLLSLQNKKLRLLGKWGMDGASGQITTRQKWSKTTRIDPKVDAQDETGFVNKSCSYETNNSDSNSDTDSFDDINQSECSDKSVFIVAMVPLQLISDNKVIWKNETPSSVYYCRPVEFLFVKETSALSKKIT